MKKYELDLDQIEEDLMKTRIFTWPAAIYAIYGFSNKWFATCTATVDYTCRGRGYVGLDLMALIGASVIFGLLCLGVFVATRQGYHRILNEYIQSSEDEK